MNDTLTALLSSRKFWVGTLSLAGVAAAVTLRALGLIPADALVPTIVAVTTTALGFIGATAYEDAAEKSIEQIANKITTTQTTNTAEGSTTVTKHEEKAPDTLPEG